VAALNVEPLLTKIANCDSLKTMPTQNVNLTPQLDRFVKNAVESGRFNNASEVHRAALAGMAKEDEERDLRLARLRQEIQLGLDSGSPTEIKELGTFMDDCFGEAMSEVEERS
jgi:antitoxin ParD1/3/4